jgi:outer membrane protein W
MKLLTRMALALVVAAASPAAASADQVFSVHGGWSAVRSADGRTTADCRSGNTACRDVLVENLTFLSFDLADFNGGTVGADWLVGLGNWAEAGVGASFYRRTVPSVYTDLVNANGDEIAQDLKLRIVPITATLRLFPLGRRGGVQPYVGAGLSYLAWRYSESGEFVDFRDNSIFQDSFVDSGSQVGAVGLGGVRFAVTDAVLVGGELRYQGGRADLDPDRGFAGERLDLGGFSSLVTLQFRF